MNSIEDPSIELCANLLKPIAVGDTRAWVFKVGGTSESVRFRIHNLNPTIARVKKGPIFKTSGGRNNKKKVKVKRLRPGDGSLQFAFYHDDPAIESRTIAGMLVEPLAELAKTFEQRAGRWLAKARGDRKVRDAIRLLAATEKELQELLGGYWELVALRDYVADRFDRAERALTGRQAFFAPPPTRIVFAVSRPRGPSLTYKLGRSEDDGAGSAKSAFDSISDLFERLRRMVGEDDLLTELRVTSKPDKCAHFTMCPWSYCPRRNETWTSGCSTDESVEKEAGTLAPVYRGYYRYNLKNRSHEIACEKGSGCVPLDLVDDRRPTLECSLKQPGCWRSGLSENRDE